LPFVLGHGLLLALYSTERKEDELLIELERTNKEEALGKRCVALAVLRKKTEIVGFQPT
jgi:hypothetical protein